MWFFLRVFPPSVDLMFQIIEITIYVYISPFINLKLSHFLNLLLKTWFLVMTHSLYAYTIIYLITYLDLGTLFLVFPYYNSTGKTQSKLSQSAVNLFACILDSIYFWSRKYILIASSDSWEMHLFICLKLSRPMKDVYVRTSFWKCVSCDWLLIFRKIVLFAERVIYLGSFK